MEKKPFVTREQLEEIKKTYPTPFHLYDEKGIRENGERLMRALSWNKGFREYFAVKATPNPFVIDIEDASEENNNFRTALWTGNNLEVTLMSIGVGDDIGLEVHTSDDQFIRIEEGEALVKMGDSQDNLDFQRRVSDGYAIMIPAGKWHDIVNLGNKPLKLYVIYAPPQHPQGTVHNTKNDAEAAEFNRIY